MGGTLPPADCGRTAEVVVVRTRARSAVDLRRPAWMGLSRYPRTLKPVGTHRSRPEPTVKTVLNRMPPEARRDSGMRYQVSSRPILSTNLAFVWSTYPHSYPHRPAQPARISSAAASIRCTARLTSTRGGRAVAERLLRFGGVPAKGLLADLRRLTPIRVAIPDREAGIHWHVGRAVALAWRSVNRLRSLASQRPRAPRWLRL
jgi:hypothetical protein